MKLSVKIIAGFSFVLLLFVVSMAVNKRFSRFVRDDISLVSHSEDILKVSSHLQMLVSNMEGSLNGYLLTGNENYVKNFYLAAFQFDNVFREESQQVRPDPTQWDKFNAIGSKVAIWRQNIASTLINAKRQALQDRTQEASFKALFDTTVMNSADRVSLDAVRKMFQEFDEHEYLKRQNSHVDLSFSLYRIDTISLVLAGFSLLIGMMVTVFVTRHTSTRINSMIALSERISEGQFNITIMDHGKDEMSRLASSMNRMTQALKESFSKLEGANHELSLSNRDLERFAYVASHDLKEPVRMVSIYTQLLTQKIEQRLDEEEKEYARYAIEGSQRIINLLNDLLAYVKLTHADLHPGQIAIGDVVEKVRQSLWYEVEQSAAQFSIGEMPELVADPVYLGQLFRHLLENAIKFRSDDRPLKINISARRSGTGWEFAVEDNGIGMDKQYDDKIFTIFQRLHNRDRYTGNGIGLTICKKIVELHNGMIWCTTKPDNGTTFYFTLPDMQAAVNE